MKVKLLFCLLAVLMSASCNNKSKYELDGLTNPLLDEWFANFKAADSSFSAGKFIPTHFSEETEKFSTAWYDCNPYDAEWLIFSPDSSFYLDLDYYTCLDCLSEDGVWMGGDPDIKVTLVDVLNEKAIDIIPANCCNGADDVFWVNDSVFVMLGSDYDYLNDYPNDPYPYISIWNREKVITRYLYDGKINNLYNEQFSPFFKRLQRIGIKY